MESLGNREAIVKVKYLINEDAIIALDKKYFSEEYLEIMMQREYERGLKEGRKKIVAEYVDINQEEK